MDGKEIVAELLRRIRQPVTAATVENIDDYPFKLTLMLGGNRVDKANIDRELKETIQGM